AAGARSGFRAAPATAGGETSCSRGGVRDDRAVRETDRAPCAPGEVGVVRDEHERRAALAVQLLEQLDDRFAGRRVEVARRLVGEQDSRLVDERAGERDALLLAARKLRRIVVEPVGEPDAGEQRL